MAEPADVQILARVLHRQMHTTDPLSSCTMCDRDATELIDRGEVRVLNDVPIVTAPGSTWSRCGACAQPLKHGRHPDNSRCQWRFADA